MNNKRATKRALLTSVMALVMCVVMLVGTTFAWFTDTASTGVNKIQAGNLDVKLEYATEWNNNGDVTKWENAEGKTLQFKKAAGAPADEQVLWEPGCTYALPELRVVNKGNLALKYIIKVTGIETNHEAVPGEPNLNDVITWEIKYSNDAVWNAEVDTFKAGYSLAPNASNVVTIKGVMDKNAGNEYQGLSIDGVSVTVYATQMTAEFDSIDNLYDKDAQYPTDADALQNALTVGGNIVLAGDADPSAAIVATKTAAINANGKTIANTSDVWDKAPNSWSLISARENADLTITGNGTFKAKENDCYAVDVQDSTATVTIENGTFIGNVHAVYVYEGTANIKGGFYSVQQKYPDASKANEFVLNCYDANYKNGTAKIIVTGGTFVNFDPSNCKAEGAGTNFVAPGYKVESETKANGDIWYTVVPNTVSSQDELDNAISGATGAVGVKLTTAGTYTLPAMTGKDVTIIGTKDTEIDMMQSGIIGSQNTGLDLTIEGATVKFANDNYKGVTHSKKLTYKDCTIKGLQFLYADDVEFINCEFVQENDDAYHVWTYGAKNVTFTDCKFNSTNNSKSVLCYIEGTGNTFTRTFNNCTFTATGAAEKSAIMINPSANAGSNTYIVNINDCTATGYAANGISGQSIVGVKETVKDNITVTINGTTVYTHNA